MTPKPIILISANLCDGSSMVHRHYTDAIIRAGGNPIIVPHNTQTDMLDQLGCIADGLLLTGGADIDGKYFNEPNLDGKVTIDAQRDEYEFALWSVCRQRSMPIFGICRGVQLLNIAYGGNIYQDLPTTYPTPVLNHSILENKHLGCHKVTIEESSVLRSTLASNHTIANSRHHQALKDIAPIFRVSARSEDGVIEAVEAMPDYNIWGVQWHPETMAIGGDNTLMQSLFDHFIHQAGIYQEAKTIPIIDSHTDTPMLFEQTDVDFLTDNDLIKAHPQKMLKGGVEAEVVVAYIPQRDLTKEGYTNAFNSAVGVLNKVVLLAEQSNEVEIVKDRIVKGRANLMLGIENGYAIGEELDNIDRFAALGVKYITLCHNGTNQICDSAIGEKRWGGISPFGKRVIEKMNSLNIVVDISHADEKVVFDALDYSSQPIIASHSSCRALCDSPRNLSDNAIKAIAQKGGVVQVCLYSHFLTNDGNAHLMDAVRHIEHIISLTGEDHVGIGSDFDGGGEIAGCRSSNELINISSMLLQRGHPKQRVEKIMGRNFLRIFGLRNYNKI